VPDNIVNSHANQIAAPALALCESDIHVTSDEPDDSVQQLLHLPATVRALRRLVAILPRFKGFDFSSDVVWYLHGLDRAIHRTYRQAVAHRRPCETCGQPITTLRLLNATKTFVVDAVENPDPKVPDEFRWTVDIFVPHVCPGDAAEASR
jgi:hypothetical protein